MTSTEYRKVEDPTLVLETAVELIVLLDGAFGIQPSLESGQHAARAATPSPAKWMETLIADQKATAGPLHQSVPRGEPAGFP